MMNLPDHDEMKAVLSIAGLNVPAHETESAWVRLTREETINPRSAR